MENPRWHLLLFLPREDDTLDKGYEVRASVNAVHYAILGSYGYTEPGRAEVVSPLFNRPPAAGRSPINSVHELVALMIDRGASRHKLLLGMSASGVSYALARPSDTSVRAPLRGGDSRGSPGPFTAKPGTMAYFEVRAT